MAPIIDMHTHLFNALDIPMEGYLISRRIERKRPCDLEYIINFFGPHMFHYLTERMRDRCVTRQLGGGKIGWYYSMLLCTFGWYMGQDMKSWESALTQTVRHNAADLMETWDNVDLFVPLVLDFEYWFKNTIDLSVDKQIDIMYRDVIVSQGGKFHAFVPFDPARELSFRNGLNNPDGQKETVSSLELVKTAIEKKGFIGIKLYNSLGYKPIGNGKEKAALYHQRVAVRNDKTSFLFDGRLYDQVLCELYAYCEKNGVPITAHCMMNGIEAYPNASSHFGAAELWKPVLEEYKGLRLNLAHFGWNPVSGRNYGHRQNWMKTICRMMLDYKNLYTDVAHHDVVTHGHRTDFIKAYKNIQRDYSYGLDRIRKKILYGSDWHVLRRLKNFRSFMKQYIRVMQKSGFYTDDDLNDFLGRNAMMFLGLIPGGKNRARLKKFYGDHNIDQPKWFRESEKTDDS
ncbi:amidohydrolase family protein [bacterium]|nr:amidohydrolase family protein [bacterium]